MERTFVLVAGKQTLELFIMLMGILEFVED
jgi:hypothetical protein